MAVDDDDYSTYLVGDRNVSKNAENAFNPVYMLSTFDSLTGDVENLQNEINIKITTEGGATFSRNVSTELVICKYDVIS
jgi:hypothetical protein